MHPERKPNRLIHEKSPYLLQHAYNPVDWYPWANEAFERAKAEDKPVFVSIGYSTCHWCHVMEKESFEDEEVAKLMNETFISIKVDREERPDLDGAYMAFCQMMGRNCGWPLNLIMTPEKKPFFAASYIPKTSRFGSPGMVDLVAQIREVWKTRRADLESVGEDLKHRVEAYENRELATELGKDALDTAYKQLSERFDTENGGFGTAPKFPSPHNLLFLLRYWNRTGEKNALAMVEKTLRKMRLGGIFDQVGFGFHRYSTDANWLVPHFEKMLYDQAMLVLAYTEAYQATRAGKFKVTAKEVLEYVQRDLTSAEGGFWSAVDADSEGEEGKFYLWTKKEIDDALPAEDKAIGIKLFDVEAAGNFSEPGKGQTGKNILHFARSLEEIASESGLTVDELIPKLAKIQKTLFAVREMRVHPAVDDKILTDWNGLMIAAFARASQVFAEKSYLEAATKAAAFILDNMRDKNGTLYHRYAKGERAVEGFLDDYAFFAWGLIELYEATFEDKFLAAALEVTDAMTKRFWDEKNGGFYFTAENSTEKVPMRKEVYDGAYPSGNSVAFLNLLRLSRLAGNSHYEELAGRVSRTFAVEVRASSAAHALFLCGVDFAVGPAYNVTLVGDMTEENMRNMIAALRERYIPDMVVSIKPPGKAGLGYEMIEGKGAAYVCRGQTCLPPTNSVEKMLELLEQGKKI